MDPHYLRSYPGSPKSDDIFQPHMPGVDFFSDMEARFAKVRSEIELGDPVTDPLEKPLREAQRRIAIITPGRMTMFIPSSPPGDQSEAVRVVEELLPSDRPLNISVISYTFLEALIQESLRCIPFLGYLLGFSYVGHSVIVFEGHPSAFESGVRGSDVLFVDSGMLPFMQDDWLDVAEQVMMPNPRIFIHTRETFTLSQVVMKRTEQQADDRRKPWWKFW